MIKKQYLAHCDICRDPAGYPEDATDNPQAARQDAQRIHGWVHKNGKDICKRCQRAKNKR